MEISSHPQRERGCQNQKTIKLRFVSLTDKNNAFNVCTASLYGQPEVLSSRSVTSEIKIIRVRPELFPDKWILHRGNAPSHTALPVKEFLAKKSTVVPDHLDYSPYLDPWDFFLFLSMKNHLKGSHFETLEEIRKVTTYVLSYLQESDFLSILMVRKLESKHN